MGDEQSLAPHAGSRERRFSAGVTATYHYYIIFFNDLHRKSVCVVVRGNDTANHALAKLSVG
jgi:hypothetical protein